MSYKVKTMADKIMEVKAISEKLEAGVKDVFESGRYEEYLQVMSRFPTYSYNNQLLIMLQHPTARYVCGYNAWQENFNRHVKYKQKAIKIFGPNLQKKTREVEDENGNITTEEYKLLKGFILLSVFADDQTEGDDLPEICKKLGADVEKFEELKAKLEKVAPCPITYEVVDGGANGFFSPKDNRIVVQEGMSESQTLKTLVHEIAHSMLHGKGGEEEKADRNTMEVQAESVAYVVCNYLGIDTSSYSFGYIAGWSKGKETKELKASLDIINKTAGAFIKEVA